MARAPQTSGPPAQRAAPSPAQAASRLGVAPGTASGTRPRTVTIGTAGHVDHGKSALVYALTGVDPDRLPEEKARGMTIVLGFAPLRLPSGRLVNLVDVPGHEALVRTMAQGAQGVQAVLLCVDCREGVMPQTREHLDILALLGIDRGLLVLTKADLLPDPRDRAEAEAWIRAALRGTFLHAAPAHWTSSRTREGLGALLDALDSLAGSLPERDASGPVRMPVDRAFTVKGWGCVVTGTLLSGTLRPGLQLALLPKGTPARVRGLQIHGEHVLEAFAGERPAVNLAGVEASAIPSGSALVDPRAFQTTLRAFAEITLLPTARPIRRRTQLDVLAGTASATARARVPGGIVRPGDTALGHLLLDQPLVLAYGDLAILRDTATSRTIGRARILDPAPPRRVDPATASGLRAASSTAEAAIVLTQAAGPSGLPETDLARRLGVTRDDLPRLIHAHKAYWTQDALIRAREALIASLPAPGHHISLRDWWARAGIGDERLLWDLTRQIVNLFRLTLRGDLLITPRRTAPPRPTVPPAPPVRPGRVSPVVIARVHAELARRLVLHLASPGAVDRIPEPQARDALATLLASGSILRISRAYVAHPDAPHTALRRLPLPCTDTQAAKILGLSRSATHALLGYMLRTGILTYSAGLYARAPSPRPATPSH
jgi:selenocysteine-specific translation elongation factor